MKKITSVLAIVLALCFLMSACNSPHIGSASVAVFSENTEDSSSAAPARSNVNINTQENWNDILSSHRFDPADVEDYALALTDHLVMRALHKIPHQGQMTDREIYDFVITLHVYRDEHEHPYYDLVTIVDRHALLQEKTVQLMVYELFGAEEWQYQSSENDAKRTNENGDNEYYFPVEMGFPTSPYSYSNARILLNDGKHIIVQFDLADQKLWPSSNLEYGAYEVTFQVTDENGSAFLRFMNCLPAE